MNADDRRFDVLRAIVADYVATHEPVASRTLVERHNLGVSSATIRNDMVALEEEGYIAQPHTSAGRVPTDKGYRLFVDRLSEVKPLSAAERRAVQSFLEGGMDLDDVLRRSVRLLAQLTRQVAVIQYPTLSRSTVRHVEVVALAPNRLLVVLILSTGRVEQRVVELDNELSDETLLELRTIVNRAAIGRIIAEAATALRGSVPDHDAATLSAVVRVHVTSQRTSQSRQWQWLCQGPQQLSLVLSRLARPACAPRRLR